MRQIALVLICISLLLAQEKDSIVVHIKGVRAHLGGSLLVEVVTEAWWKNRKLILPGFIKKVALSKNENYTVTFQIPYADSPLAVRVIHDANSSGELDMRVFPYPKPLEGAGFSNNYIPTGPPRFKNAQFVLKKGSVATQVITLVYP